LIPALFWSGVLFACVLTLAPAFIFGVRPALDHRKHQRTLANIARLEAELGYDVPLEVRIDRELQQENQQWYSSAILKASYYGESPRHYGSDGPEPAQRIYGDCAVCGKHVVVNAGKCRGATTRGTDECAKLVWLRTAT
jgi:hypothetical protein